MLPTAGMNSLCKGFPAGDPGREGRDPGVAVPTEVEDPPEEVLVPWGEIRHVVLVSVSNVAATSHSRYIRVKKTCQQTIH